MKKFKQYTLKEYAETLSKKTPVPGGGSASALTGALGASLLSMAARYSVGRSRAQGVNRRLKQIIIKAEKARKRLLDLVDKDAQAYMRVVESKSSSSQKKRKAINDAKKIPKEVRRLCYSTVQLAPFLIKNGSPYLIADVEAAVEMLLASFNSSKAFLKP